MPEGIRLHLGCGLTTPEGWVNVDGSWNARLARYPVLRKSLAALHIIPRGLAEVKWRNVKYHDLRRPLPWGNGVASAVYASHVLEHLYADQALSLVQEAFRVLQPEGVIRLMVPDLEKPARQYLSELDTVLRGESCVANETPADRFLAELLFRPKAAPRGFWAYRLYNQLTELQDHKWMYDGVSLQHLLRQAGFSQVAVAHRHNSRIADITAVETNHGLIVEGIKETSR